MTLDQIEQTVLPGFNDPRLFLALGRGALGSGRLRSEAFTGSDLERQLSDVAAECISRSQCIQVDRGANTVKVSSIFSWRERDFTGAYGDSGRPEVRHAQSDGAGGARLRQAPPAHHRGRVPRAQ